MRNYNEFITLAYVLQNLLGGWDITDISPNGKDEIIITYGDIESYNIQVMYNVEQQVYGINFNCNDTLHNYDLFEKEKKLIFDHMKLMGYQRYEL